MDRAEQAASQKLNELLAIARDPAAEGPSVRFVAWEHGALRLSGAGAQLYDATLDTLLRLRDVAAKFSEAYVAKQLQAMIEDALLHADFDTLRAVRLLQQSAVDYTIEQTVVLPIIGLEIVVPELTLGVVTIRKLEGAVLAEVRATMTEVINSTIETRESKSRLVENHMEVLGREFVGRAVSVCRIVAEPDRALERALDETRRSLELIRYAILQLYRRDQRVGVGLTGDIPRQQQTSMVLSTQNYNLARNATGPVSPFTVSAEALAEMRRIGVFELSDILKRDVGSSSDFERALINAVHWIAGAQMQAEPENAFLNLITCLEALLTPRDGNPIGTAIAESVAILIGETVEQRIGIKKRVRDLYSKRSAVSHGGGKAILDEELQELESLAGAVLARLISRRGEFHSQKALTSWFEEVRLSGGVASPTAS